MKKQNLINTIKKQDIKNYQINKMNTNEINIIYKVNKVNNEDKIRIFGYNFVENNKKICKFIYNNKEYELTEKFEVANKDKLEIKLIGINNVTNMSCLFAKCKNLVSLPDISKWNTENITDMSYLFYHCYSLEYLDDI